MAKRKREEREPRREEQKAPAPALRPETRHGVLIVLLFALAALALLALVNVAGSFGQGLRRGLLILFGWARWGVPALLALVGLGLTRPNRPPIRGTQVLGGVALVLSITALLNLGGQSLESGTGGGVVGAILWTPLTAVMGRVATSVVCLAIGLIGLLLLFNASLQTLFQRGQTVGRIVDQAREKFRQASQRAEEQTPALPSFEHRPLGSDQPPAASDQPKAVSRAPVAGGQTALFSKPKRVRRAGLTYPLDLLERDGSKPTSANIELNKEKIAKTLENFGIQVEMGEVNVGPTVTQFTLKPSEGVKLAQITTLANDLALALAAHPIRIEAPIPGKSLVGIEVPNQKVGLVNLRDLLESDTFKQRRSPMTFALGRDVAGQPVVADLDPMPHLLIAGATGSGKSVCINALILSLLASNGPEELKFILVDPKRVELPVYNELPHLLTPVVTETQKTIQALRWVVGEMDRRFQLLSETGKRNIQVYRQEVNEEMPYLVVVIDELADLMAVAATEVESAIIRLAQMARAVGIHLVVATQRPSVDVITGLIKANITSRLAFNVASVVDSRTILDHAGAEKLLGRGDMLFVSSDLSKPRRIQGAFVSDGEIERVTAYLREQAQPDYREEILEKPAPSLGASLDDLGDDELLAQAKDVILRAGKASASLLQRRLRIGYARAARILDLLEEQGFIGPGEGAKPREILVARPANMPVEEEENEPDQTSSL